MRIAVISDVHVSAHAIVPADLTRLVPHLIDLEPSLVVLNGDSTNGNADDGVPLETVRTWWTALHGAIAALGRSGIPVLPIAGNHDYYTAPQRQAYAEAWQNLAADVAPLALSGHAPLYYSVDVED